MYEVKFTTTFKKSYKLMKKRGLDLSLFDDVIEQLRQGKPPIGNDGNPIQLHHVIQKENGPVVEIREVTHKEYYHALHGLVESGGSFRNNPILIKQFNNFRVVYWKWRAKQIMERKNNERKN